MTPTSPLTGLLGGQQAKPIELSDDRFTSRPLVTPYLFQPY